MPGSVRLSPSDVGCLWGIRTEVVACKAFLLVTGLEPWDCKSNAKASKVRILHPPPHAERAPAAETPVGGPLVWSGCDRVKPAVHGCWWKDGVSFGHVRLSDTRRQRCRDLNTLRRDLILALHTRGVDPEGVHATGQVTTREGSGQVPPCACSTEKLKRHSWRTH